MHVRSRASALPPVLCAGLPPGASSVMGGAKTGRSRRRRLAGGPPVWPVGRVAAVARRLLLLQNGARDLLEFVTANLGEATLRDCDE